MQYTKTEVTLESIVLNQNEMLEINAPQKFWMNNVLISTMDFLNMDKARSHPKHLMRNEDVP